MVVRAHAARLGFSCRGLKLGEVVPAFVFVAHALPRFAAHELPEGIHGDRYCEVVQRSEGLRVHPA